MNYRDNTPIIFLGKKLKVLVSKLLQNPEYYPTKYNSKTKRRFGKHNESMW